MIVLQNSDLEFIHVQPQYFKKSHNAKILPD